MTASTRLRLAAIIIGIGCLAGMAISFRAWVSVGTWGRSFPNIPIIPGMRNLPQPWDVVQICITAILFVGVVIRPRSRVWALAAIIAGVLLILGDWSRLQPWLYEYLIMLGVLSLCRAKSPGDDRFTVGSLRLIIVCLYIFSGLHKVNVAFVNETVPLMLKQVTNLLPAGWSLSWSGWIMAGTETLLGILLAMRSTRVMGVFLALAMHLAILLLIGPLGQNYNHVVWPWNLTMMALVCVLFWPRGAEFAPMQSILSKARQAQGVFNAPIPPGLGAMFGRFAVIVLAAIIPIGGLIDWVDMYLSWCMYAGPPAVGAVQVSDEAIARLPGPLKAQVQDLSTTGKTIVFLDWSFADLRVVYPEWHMYRAVAAELSPFAPSKADMTLLLIGRPSRWSSSRSFEKVPLGPRE